MHIVHHINVERDIYLRRHSNSLPDLKSTETYAAGSHSARPARIEHYSVLGVR